MSSTDAPEVEEKKEELEQAPSPGEPEADNAERPDGEGGEEAMGEICISDYGITELDLNYQRIGQIGEGELDRLQNLECLYLRWNLLKKIENLQSLVTLKELELYGNQITTIEGLDTLVNLEILDLSFNRITEIKGLENLTKLEKLFLSANKISKIEKLSHMSNLKMLELGNNKIRHIENLELLTNLESLYLGKNKISQIRNLHYLKKLKILSVQCNRLTKIENLDELTELEDLYISENGIEVIENLESNTKLKTLDLAMNKIQQIQNIEHLHELEEFWINNNNISDWHCVDRLSANKKLNTVYLEGNPLFKDPNYRRKIKLAVPWISQIDATMTKVSSSKKEFVRVAIIPKSLQDLSDEEKGAREVCDSDSDLSEENLNASDHESETEQESDTERSFELTSEDCYIGQDNISKWYKRPICKKSKNLGKNIFPGPCGEAINAKTEIETFQLFFDDYIVNEIITCTNVYISSIRCKFSRERDCQPITREEILALFGILYFLGIKKYSKANVVELWSSDGSGHEILRGVMSYKRFLFLLKSLRFDDFNSRSERRSIDKLAAIRNIYDEFVKNCQNNYSMTEYVNIDEMLLGFRGRCSWVQFMPNKPGKYGIKLFALCDVKTKFCANMEIYCGEQPYGPYYQSNTPSEIVKRLVKPIENSNRNLTTDSWFTSVKLADYLLRKGVTMLGPLKKSTEELPLEFLPNRKNELGKSIFGFQKDKIIVAYTTKRNKNVILLSSMHDSQEIDQITSRPIPVIDYTRSKGGVNSVEQMVANYTVSRITKRWPLVIFYFMLNISGLNAFVIHSFQNNESTLRRRQYLKNLAMELMKPQLKTRAKIPTLPFDIKQYLNQNYAPLEPQGPPEKKRKGTCHICKRMKNSSTTLKCNTCMQFSCKNHCVSVHTCFVCINSNI